MKIQRKRLNDIISKYNAEGITSNGLVHGNYATETQGFRINKGMYYVLFNYENGKYSLARRFNNSPEDPYFVFTSELYYRDFKKILIEFLEMEKQ